MKFVRGGLQMTTIRDCIAPDRNPKVPGIKLPDGSIDTHVHIFESQYPLFEEEAIILQIQHLMI